MIYLTSDQHFNHKNVLAYCKRPFKSIEEMNETIINNFNEIVTDNDETYHLGDFALGNRDNIKEILQKLNGTHYLIPGNHDACFPIHKRKKEVKEYLHYGFDRVMEMCDFTHRINIFDEDVSFANANFDTVLFHHYPYINPNNPPQWNKNFLQKSDRFNWLFHGHIHEKRKIDIKNKMVNVGVDVWDFKPITLDQIKKEINKLI